MTIEDKIISDLATKYGMTKEQIKDIVKSQFKFVKEGIERKEQKPIYLPKFGSFRINIGALKYIKEKKVKSSIDGEAISDINNL